MFTTLGMDHLTSSFAEHPLDVLKTWQDWQAVGQSAALLVLCETVGGAVRDIGALMAVNQEGLHCGYMSGGCIDADLILRAQAALRSGRPQQIRYGAGSPFIDLPLPCGGAIEVLMLPTPDTARVTQIIRALETRQAVSVQFHPKGAIRLGAQGGTETGAVTVTYEPKLRVRLAGRGADCLALAKLCCASQIEVQVFCVDDADLDAATELGVPARALETPQTLPVLTDDAWTAFVLMFHDREWEGPLLSQALSGPAFYIGAVGSHQTHAKRCAALLDSGRSDDDVKRIRGPIGLVPSLRNASHLAISVLAELIDAFRNRLAHRAARTAVILLAAGQAKRFGSDDKLLAELNGQSVLSHALNALPDLPFGPCLAVVPSLDHARTEAFAQSAWRLLVNPNPEQGQASSLQIGLAAIEADPSIDQILILLADMPHVPARHISALLRELTPQTPAVMSDLQPSLGPPALIKRSAFQALRGLSGDAGAKSILQDLPGLTTVPLTARHAQDIDTPQDLNLAKALTDG